MWEEIFMKFMDILENEFSLINRYSDVSDYKLIPRAFSMDSNWTFFDYIIFILANKVKSLTLEIENFVEHYF